MIGSQTLLAALFIVIFSSCDPSHRLLVSNQSKAVKQIKVQGICKSFVGIESSSSDSTTIKKQGVVQTSPCIDSSFSFELLPGKTAVVENELGPIPYSRMIIIDGSDTVQIKKSKGRVSKKPRFWPGGDYTLTISE